MSNQITIESLPNEILMCILRYLDWCDLDSAMLVCQRWASARASLVFDNGSTSLLKIYMSEEPYEAWRTNTTYPTVTHNYEEVIEALFLSPRLHKNLFLIWNTNDTPSQRILSILNRLSQCVKSLKIRSYCIPGYIIDRDLSIVLEIFTNLNNLDIENIFIRARTDTANEDVPGCIALSPMNQLRSLHAGEILGKNDAGGSVLEIIHNTPDVFANLTELHAVIHSDDLYLKDLYHKLSSRLKHLRLYSSVDLFTMFPDEQFPMLETFEVLREKLIFGFSLRTSDEHLGRFVKNAPKLKNLNLQRYVTNSLLQILRPLQKTLKILKICVDTLKLEFFQRIQRFSYLEQLELNFDDLDLSSRPDDPPELPSVRELKLASIGINEIWSISQFPNLTVLKVNTGDFMKNCPSLTNQVPSLCRLVISDGCDTIKLEPFLKFCSKLKVPELETYGCTFKIGNWKSSTPRSQALYLRKLIIHTYEIEPGFYAPMLGSMPALRKLELDLVRPCDSSIIKTLLIKFPRCDVVRLNKSLHSW